MQVTINKTKLELVKGDITHQDTEAIVNAANSALAGGGGVGGGPHPAGGADIMHECRLIGGCPTGSAVITTGGKLAAKFVIHAVGPVYRGGRDGESHLLASAYRSSLELASENGVKSIAFPSISTGAYGYPLTAAARIALLEVRDYLNQNDDIELVRFVLFNDSAFRAFSGALRSVMSKS